MEEYPINENCYLHEKVIIPKTTEEDEIYRYIRMYQILYEALLVKVKLRLQKMIQSNEVKESVFCYEKNREYWNEIDSTFKKQQIWKKIGMNLFKGLRDQNLDFNKAVAESVPASWALKVDGRPVPTVDNEEVEEEEDTVCMCCFDSSSVEG